MKTIKISLLLGIGVILALSTGCEISTQAPQQTSIMKPANNIVINELFILPPPRPYAHHWIEFYNPTTQRIRMSNWTLGFKSRRFYVATDTTGIILKAFFQDTIPRYYDVPLQSRFTVTIGTNVVQTTSSLSLRGGDFMTIVSDAEMMKNFTEWGSDGGIKMNLGGPIRAEGSLKGKILFSSENLLFFRADSSQIDSVAFAAYEFSFASSDQIILKDSTGNAVDVLRYGSYIYSGPGNDPYPGNRSLGPIVPYESFARFAGAYTSGSGGNAARGSSADDFYVTGVDVANTVPIPHWLSQASKKQ